MNEGDEFMSLSESLPIIDAHTHIWGDVKGIHEIMKHADRLGIQQVCVSSLMGGNYYPDPGDIRKLNDQVRECMRLYPGRILGFCYVNPRHRKKALEEFRRSIEDCGMVGLKLWVATFCNSPLVFPLVEKAIDYGVPVLVHAWLKRTGNLPNESNPLQVADLSVRYPESTIIMAHVGGDWEFGIKSVRNCPNVFVDTSGTITHMGMIEKAVRVLGAERVVFGSDAPADLYMALAKVTCADIKEEEKALLLSDNMRRILGRRY